jgi:hypothetical protein
MRAVLRGKTPARPERGLQKWAVVAERADGARRIFQTYADEATARAVAARLISVGCRAIVELE